MKINNMSKKIISFALISLMIFSSIIIISENAKATETKIINDEFTNSADGWTVGGSGVTNQATFISFNGNGGNIQKEYPASSLAGIEYNLTFRYETPASLVGFYFNIDYINPGASQNENSPSLSFTDFPTTGLKTGSITTTIQPATWYVVRLDFASNHTSYKTYLNNVLIANLKVIGTDTTPELIRAGYGGSASSKGSLDFLNVSIGSGEIVVPPVDESDLGNIVSNPYLTAIVGDNYSYQLTVNGATSYSLTGNATSWLSISDLGLVYGTPTTEGYYNVGVHADNDTDGVFQNYRIDVYSDTSITGLKYGSWLTNAEPGHMGQAVYWDSNIIYLFNGYYDGNGLSVFAIKYNMTTQTWTNKVLIGDGSVDGHGGIKGLIDSVGRVHVFYGGHNSVEYYKVSGIDGDISTWTTKNSIFTGTYPIPYFDYLTNKLYIMYRGDTGHQNGDWCFKVSSDNGDTWSAENKFAQSSNDPGLTENNIGLIYFGSCVPVQNSEGQLEFWMSGDHREDAGPTPWQILIRLNVVTGHTLNWNGTDLGINPSFNTLHANAIKTYSSNTFAWDEGLILDGNGYPHLIFAVKSSDGSSIWKHLYYNGAIWIYESIIAEYPGTYNQDNIGYWDNTTNSMTVYLINTTNSVNVGELEKWIWHPSTGWNCDGVILAKNQIDTRAVGLNGVEFVVHGPNHELVFGEFNGTGYDVSPSSSPIQTLRGYVYNELTGFKPYHDWISGGNFPENQTWKPSITNSPNTAIVKGQFYTYTPNANESVTWELISKPGWANWYEGNHTISGIPTNNNTGHFIIRATSTSGTLYTDISWSVIHANSPNQNGMVIIVLAIAMPLIGLILYIARRFEKEEK